MNQMKIIHKNTERGFTFIELLLVLTVFTIITLIILPIGDKWIQETSEEAALQSFIASVYSLQSYAIANDVYTQMQFRDSGTMYISSAPGKGVLSRNVFPKGMRVASSSPLAEIGFHHDGDIVKSGTLTIQTNNRMIQIRFQFQRGRMIISG
jgi:competence protein ComGD